MGTNDAKHISDPELDTRRGYALGRSPHEFLEEQVARTPEAPALRMGERILSYRELNARANRLAHLLREQGAGPEKLIASYVDHCFDTVASLLANLKAGAEYLPLDPRSLGRRIWNHRKTSSCAVTVPSAEAGRWHDAPGKLSGPRKGCWIQHSLASTEGTGNVAGVMETPPRGSRLPGAGNITKSCFSGGGVPAILTVSEDHR